MPAASIAVDIVNLGGQSISGDGDLNSVSVQYLPGAVLGITLGSEDETEDAKQRVSFLLLPLTSDDDGQTIRLGTTNWPLVFKNDKICWAGLSEAREAIDSARANDDSSEARDLEERLQSSIETLKDAYDSDELPESCIAQISSDSEDLKLLRGFKDSGIGLMSSEDLPSGIAKVIESVNPSSLAIPSSLLERTERHLATLLLYQTG